MLLFLIFEPNNWKTTTTAKKKELILNWKFALVMTLIVSFCVFPGDSSYHMKILVPAVASGAIIGKGGETIASLQKDTGARVKMSKSHDFYPG